MPLSSRQHSLHFACGCNVTISSGGELSEFCILMALECHRVPQFPLVISHRCLLRGSIQSVPVRGLCRWGPVEKLPLTAALWITPKRTTRANFIAVPSVCARSHKQVNSTSWSTVLMATMIQQKENGGWLLVARLAMLGILKPFSSYRAKMMAQLGVIWRLNP